MFILIKGDSIKGDSIKGDTIKGDTIKGDTIKGDSIKGDSIKGDTIKGDSIKGDTIKRCIKGDTIKGDSIKGDSIKGDSIKGDSINGDSIKKYNDKPPKTFNIIEKILNCFICEKFMNEKYYEKVDKDRIIFYSIHKPIKDVKIKHMIEMSKDMITLTIEKKIL